MFFLSFYKMHLTENKSELNLASSELSHVQIANGKSEHDKYQTKYRIAT